MQTKTMIQLAATLGAMSVGIGAFGAHGLADILESTGRTETFETAVKYQFYHGLAILGCAILSHQYPGRSDWKWAARLFLVGIIVFSGSLYVLSLTGVTWLGAITPLGGLAFLMGWGWMARGASKLNG
ncbi:MAG: DUF423 domain-containing protein [Lunatimonas sp.]|uniref:DUF423 domain-containing protein n=1 Tax=Lunatimonas sp. TaxID=2060141 RepID=UPI00263BA575|nr:DUF423 domain-containing protein [Lunatimonas sp.]MCC5939038.1 DUF423 domain-containing protein [Lunatimonas sp.]